MNKKAYMKPTLQAVELKERTTILAVSLNEYGMNKNLEEEEVNEGW